MLAGKGRYKKKTPQLTYSLAKNENEAESLCTNAGAHINYISYASRLTIQAFAPYGRRIEGTVSLGIQVRNLDAH